MPVSPRVKLPLLFSALMGLCVLGSEGYVLSGLIRQHAETAGFPANNISEVRATIDPTTAD